MGSEVESPSGAAGGLSAKGSEAKFAALPTGCFILSKSFHFASVPLQLCTSFQRALVCHRFACGLVK